MNDYGQINEEVVSFLLTEYPSDSPMQYLEDVLFNYLTQRYNLHYVEQYMNNSTNRLRGLILEEFNRRVEQGAMLRFELLGDTGDKIRGVAAVDQIPAPVRFQDALQKLNPNEFERLSAVILRLAGCADTWVTPESHDQGLDAFGYLRFFKTKQLVRWVCRPEVVFLAQAKHYKKDKVSSYHIREFYGSCELAKKELYSVQGEKYRTLQFRPASPVAMVYVTSGEVSLAAKTLIQNVGIVLLASEEICALFTSYWRSIKQTLPRRTNEVVSMIRRELTGLRVAT